MLARERHDARVHFGFEKLARIRDDAADLHATRSGIEHRADRGDTAVDIEALESVDLDLHHLADLHFREIPLRHINDDPHVRGVGDYEERVGRIRSHFAAGIDLAVCDYARNGATQGKTAIEGGSGRHEIAQSQT